MDGMRFHTPASTSASTNRSLTPSPGVDPDVVQFHPAPDRSPVFGTGLEGLPNPDDAALTPRGGDSRREAIGVVRAARDKLLKARRDGVDLARSTFMRRLLGTAMNGLSMGVAAVLTAASGGALAPLLVVATLRFISAAADATAAYDACKRAERGEAPHPMGTNGFGRLLYEHAVRDGKPQQEAVEQATRRSANIQIALAAGSLIAALPLGAVTLPVQICRTISSGLLSGLGLFDREHVRRQAEYDAHVADAQRVYAAAADRFVEVAGEALNRQTQDQLVGVADLDILNDPEVDAAVCRRTGQAAPARETDTVRQRVIDDERGRHKVVTGITFSSFLACGLGFLKLLTG